MTTFAMALAFLLINFIKSEARVIVLALSLIVISLLSLFTSFLPVMETNIYNVGLLVCIVQVFINKKDSLVPLSLLLIGLSVHSLNYFSPTKVFIIINLLLIFIKNDNDYKRFFKWFLPVLTSTILYFCYKRLMLPYPIETLNNLDRSSLYLLSLASVGFSTYYLSRILKLNHERQLTDIIATGILAGSMYELLPENLKLISLLVIFIVFVVSSKINTNNLLYLLIYSSLVLTELDIGFLLISYGIIISLKTTWFNDMRNKIQITNLNEIILGSLIVFYMSVGKDIYTNIFVVTIISLNLFKKREAEIV